MSSQTHTTAPVYYDPPARGDLNLDAMPFEDLLEAGRHLQTFADYAWTKAAVERRRLAGDVQGAADLDAWCRKLYQQLPANWRWPATSAG